MFSFHIDECAVCVCVCVCVCVRAHVCVLFFNPSSLLGVLVKWVDFKLWG